MDPPKLNAKLDIVAIDVPSFMNGVAATVALICLFVIVVLIFNAIVLFQRIDDAVDKYTKTVDKLCEVAPSERQ